MKITPATALVLTALGSGCLSPAQMKKAAIECAVERTGTPAPRLTLQRGLEQVFPVTGKKLYRHNFLSQDTGQVALCDLDENGAQADEHALAEAERVARVRRYGRMDPGFANLLSSTMAASDRRWVRIQIPVHEPKAGAGSNLFREPRAAAAEKARVQAEIRAGLAKVLALLPSTAMVEPPEHDSPFFRALLTASEITAVAASNDVGAVMDGEEPRKVPLGPDTCRVNQVFLTNTGLAHDLGLTGTGVKVATLEQVCQNPYLPFNPMDATHAQVPQGCVDPGGDHGSSVLGYIANTSPYDPEQLPPDPAQFGIAPHAELFSANGPTTPASYAWMASKGIAIANYSFYAAFNPSTCPFTQSQLNALSDYYATHPPYILSVTGAGNDDVISTGCAAHKVLNILHNGIVVGPAFARQTWQCPPGGGPCGYNYAKSYDRTLDWTRKTYSGDWFVWANPDAGWGYLEVGDLELPHMVSYADGMRWSLLNFCEAGGTSFAAPQVSGAAALLSGQNGALYGRPEALKAVLMAGADVNTDLNTPGLGAPYSFQPRYNGIGFGGTIDRHGGVGLLNSLASVQIGAPLKRMKQNARYGIPFATALGNTQAAIQTYQHTLDAAIDAGQWAPGITGHDYGVMDPDADFVGIWYKNYYYFTPTASGNLRIVLTWNRPYVCTFGPTTSCGLDMKPDLNLVLRNLASPTGAAGAAVTWDPNEEFMSVPVVAGQTYRLDIYKQNYWPGPESFGLAAHLTSNAQ